MKEKTTRISACGLIINADNQILLARLSPMVESYAGSWTLVGGGIDYAEHPKGAVAREVFEETGLKVSHIGNLLDVDSAIVEFHDKTVHAIRIIYDVQVADGKIVVEQGGSTDDVAWFFYEEARKLPLVSLAEKGLSLWNR